MNRRLLTFFLMMTLSLLISFPVFGKDENLQEVFEVDSPVYRILSGLYLSEGHSLPSGSGPWTSAELHMMLEVLDLDSMSDSGKALYSWIENKISGPATEEPLDLQFSPRFTAEVYLHTNPDDFSSEKDWRMDFEERAPMIALPVETWAGDLFYFSFNPIVTLNEYDDTSDSSKLYGDSILTTNVLMIPPSDLTDLNMNIPYSGMISFGGEFWNIQFGRGDLYWGSGETGSLILGDHMLYQDYLKYTHFDEHFKFTTVASFFSHPMNYYTGDPDVSDSSGVPIDPRGQGDDLSGFRMFLAHRAEFRLLDDRLNLAISEGMMYMSEDNTLNIGYLNPMGIFHDNYIRDNSNSILTFEAAWTPVDHWGIFAQAVVDEFALPGEPTSGSGTNPEAMGILGGVKTAYPLGAGLFYGSLEAAVTDPYLYLRGKNYDQQQGDYGLNYVIGIRQFSPGGNISYEEDFLGFEYGNDAVTLQLFGGYGIPGDLTVEATLLGIFSGTHDMYTLWRKGNDTDTDPSSAEPLTTTPYSPNHYSESDLRDAIETTWITELKGSKQWGDLEVYGQFDFVYRLNSGGFSSSLPETDFQFSLGLSWAP